MRLYKVGAKACEGVSYSRYMVHAWPQSTAPQPVGFSCDSILKKEENSQSQVEIDQ